VDPEHWKVNKDKDVRKRSKAPAPTFATPEVPAVSQKPESSEESMEWDSEEGEFVPKTNK